VLLWAEAIVRCHISTSGNAQFDAELAQLESKDKCFLHADNQVRKTNHFCTETLTSVHNCSTWMRATPYLIPLPIWSKMPPNMHSLNLQANFMRSYITPQLQFTLTCLPHVVKSPGRRNRLAYIRRHISTSGNAQFDAEIGQLESHTEKCSLTADVGFPWHVADQGSCRTTRAN